ncbi:MAG TPA: methyltransferase domain-containing protein [Rhizomicrobium sp.]|jgi:2-polyprenyl-6-hydroxyphenyl methylase/3-demethylubiquinone-9 3-methyltransferase
MAALTHVESHFRFGENWAEFAHNVDRDRIDQARRDLARLIGKENLSGLTFLDIGSGSGIHSLAALQLGATVTAIDIDPESVATTKGMLERFAANAPWCARLASIFNLEPASFGRFDIVYSWGVLHHTGAMLDAIRAAAGLVKDDGVFCVALYGQTALCGLWRWEKRLYSRAPGWMQRALQKLYVSLFWLLQSARGARRGRFFSLREHVQNYMQRRGMNFYTDVHDWLGGYPYESISPEKLRDFMRQLGFVEQRSFILPGVRHGLLGSGCDEYVFVKRATR